MRKINIYIIFLFLVIPIYGCKKIEDLNKLDANSYINNFELLQENPNNESKIKISSPEAIIDSMYNDIQIFDGTIYVINKNGQDFQVKSGNSTLNNSSNMLHVYNKVNISLIDSKDFYILTNSLNWDLNASNIELDNPLYINFENTKINSLNGSYDINSNLLKIYKNIFNRKIFNKKDENLYNIKILSEKAMWYQNDNSIEFSSPNSQVEATIDFLRTK